jgi:RHS repeat-associated protein
MVEPGRNNADSEYRYGFNGKENVNEVEEVGNNIDFKARIYDTRLGKFVSIDPVVPLNINRVQMNGGLFWFSASG